MDPTMQQFEAQLNRVAAVMRHLQQKIDGLESFQRQGGFDSSSQMRESFEKIDRALAYNREYADTLKRLLANNGAVFEDQIPGKREPFWFEKAITIPAGSTTRVTASEATSSSGPMGLTAIMATARMNIALGVPTPPGGVIAREFAFRSINSAIVEPFAAPNPAAAAMPSYAPDSTYQFVFDFLWEYQTGKSNRRRMNAPVPSAFLFTEQGRPAYLPCTDLLPAADNIAYTIDPLAPTRAWLGGVLPGPVTDTAQSAVVDFCFLAILFTQPPDYRV